MILMAKEIDEDRHYGLFLRAFSMGLKQLGITDIHFAPAEVSKNVYNTIKREDNKLVFTMVRGNTEEQEWWKQYHVYWTEYWMKLGVEQ